MIAAAALLLMSVGATEPEPPVLRPALEPRWTAAAQTRPLDVNYKRDPGQMIAGSARADFLVDPATTVFMQARKQKPESEWASPKGLAKASRAVSVGMALHW